MLENWGVQKLGKLEYEASMDEMNHADQIKRILFLKVCQTFRKWADSGRHFR